MKNVNMRYLHWGPYVGSTKLDNHILERLHEDGKKELESYHKKLAGHVKRQVKYNDETTDWFYKQVSPIFVLAKCCSALVATYLGSRSYLFLVSGSATSQIIARVG